MLTKHITASWKSIVICLVLLIVWITRPIGIHPPKSLDTDFNTDRAIARLTTILGDERPHPIDSEANDAVRERLLQQIRNSGFTPQIEERFHCNDHWGGAAVCAYVRNVYFWVNTPGKDAVLLLSHYDSVAAGPGAADDGIGVAVALEAAHLLKEEALARPLLVLFTDGEEAGLVGAAAFAARSPLAKSVGSVVNLEARGTTGVASMFQTSSPNGNDVAALLKGGAKGGVVPAANSLATDLYKILPNDTDLSVMLPLGVDAANYAIIGGGKRYHTALDDLAHLDARSVRHMGANVVSAIRGFARVEKQIDEKEMVYMDVNQTMLWALSKTTVLLLLVLGLLSSVALFARSEGTKPIKTFFIPLLAVVVGTVFSVGIGMLISILRPETDFATAYPQALRAVYGAGALFGASLVLQKWKIKSDLRLATAGWAWLIVLILAAYFVLPGLSTLVLGSLFCLIFAAVLSFIPKLKTWIPAVLIIAALLFILIALPLVGGIEDGLFIENAAPISMFMAFMFIFFMPIAKLRSWATPILCGALLLISTFAALIVPAFTRDAPRHLSVIHRDNEGVSGFLIYNNGPLPKAMSAVANFADVPDEKGYWRAPAPALERLGHVDVVSDEMVAGIRTLTFTLEDTSADRHDFIVKNGDGVQELSINGVKPNLAKPLTYFGCSGRTCRNLTVSLTLKEGASLPEIIWRRHQYGAGKAAEALVKARPAEAQAVHVGDKRTHIRALKLTKD